MSTMTLTQRNGSAQGVNPWMRTTVQQFFQGLNWENRPQPQSQPSQPTSDAKAAPLSAASVASPNLTVSVSQYFAALAWEGTPAIAAPVPVEEPAAPAPAEKNVTLDDFFGSF